MKTYKFNYKTIKKNDLNGFFSSFPKDKEYTDGELEMDTDNIWGAIKDGAQGYPDFKSRAEVKEYILDRLMEIK